jgi:hypothetical protein
VKAAVIIAFRDRGGDPQRSANLARVTDHWSGYDCKILVTSDGRADNAQFNRSSAYNRAVGRGLETATNADVLIFAESDMLISFDQIDRAVALAVAAPGMVIPFSWFMALSEGDSRRVRAHEVDPVDCDTTAVKGHRGSIGAVNVMSRDTYDLVGGYDERFEGAWYDDDAMKIAFDIAAGPTRWVEGSAYHLYHLSGGGGEHLSREDRVATSRNRQRLRLYQQARTPEQIRSLTRVGS